MVLALPIVSVSIPDRLLQEVDSVLSKQGFSSRSEIVRYALREFMAERGRLRELEGEITSTITVIYERGAKNEQILNAQHGYGDVILTFLHCHVDEKHCLEVMVVKGDAGMIGKLVDALKANKRVAQVKVAVLRRPESPI